MQTRPFLINHITLYCCYKLFKLLQTYQIDVKLRIIYITRRFEPYKQRFKGKISTFIPALVLIADLYLTSSDSVLLRYMGTVISFVLAH